MKRLATAVKKICDQGFDFANAVIDRCTKLSQKPAYADSELETWDLRLGKS